MLQDYQSTDHIDRCDEKNYKKKIVEAAKDGKLEALRNLAQFIDVNTVIDEENCSRGLLHIAAQQNNNDLVKLLINLKADLEKPMLDEGTALLDAAAGNHHEIVQTLLSAGAKITATDQDGSTALDWALEDDCLEAVKVIYNIQPDLILAKKPNGNTLLHLASKKRAEKVAKFLLLEKQLDPTLKNDEQETAAQIAEEEDLLDLSKAIQAKIDKKTICRQKRVEKKYFDYKRSQSEITMQLLGNFLQERQKKNPGVHKITGIRPRKLITANAGALGIIIDSLSEEEQKRITTCDEIAKITGWYNCGYRNDENANKNWAWEYLHFQLGVDPNKKSKNKTEKTLTTRCQLQPSVGYFGNIHVWGIGRYGVGATNYILQIINEITEEKQEKEQQLAKLFLQYLQTGMPITYTALSTIRFFHYQKDRDIALEHINRVLILTCIKEITRFMYLGYKDGKRIEELPFALGFVEALLLLTDGHLRMSQVFDKDAEYGLPTDSNVVATSTQIDKTRNKLISLNRLFEEKYPHQSQNTQEYYKRLLKRTFASTASDTEGSDYFDDEDKTLFCSWVTGSVIVFFRSVGEGSSRDEKRIRHEAMKRTLSTIKKFLYD